MVEAEIGSFIPIIITTGGVISKDTYKVVNKLSGPLAKKNGTCKSKESSNIRTKLSFTLLRVRLTSLRGTRRKRQERTIFQQQPLKNFFEIHTLPNSDFVVRINY